MLLAVPILAALGALSCAGQDSQDRTVPGNDPRVRNAAAVKDRHMEALFKLPAVVGAGVGLSQADPGSVVIQVFVSRKLKPRERKRFPSKLDGVPVEIQVSGEFRTQPSRRRP